jgi:hypothetical protein
MHEHEMVATPPTAIEWHSCKTEGFVHLQGYVQQHHAGDTRSHFASLVLYFPPTTCWIEVRFHIDELQAAHAQRFGVIIRRSFAIRSSQLEGKNLRRTVICDLSMPLAFLPTTILTRAELCIVQGVPTLVFDIPDTADTNCLW